MKRQGKEPVHRRRHAAPPPGGLHRNDQALHDGAIGDVVAGRVLLEPGRALWCHAAASRLDRSRVPNPQLVQFPWLCGDHIVEQHVHNLDVINWVLNAHPVKAVGMGGRQVRTDPEYGEIFDHFAVDYEYPNGVHVLSMCRQIDWLREQRLRGRSRHQGQLPGQRYTYDDQRQGELEPRQAESDVDPYVQEHTDLIASIRAGKPVNELKSVAESTLTAIMGRMSAYTGKNVTWDEAMNSKEDLMPQEAGLEHEPAGTAGGRPGQDAVGLRTINTTIKNCRSPAFPKLKLVPCLSPGRGGR